MLLQSANMYCRSCTLNQFKLYQRNPFSYIKYMWYTQEFDIDRKYILPEALILKCASLFMGLNTMDTLIHAGHSNYEKFQELCAPWWDISSD